MSRNFLFSLADSLPQPLEHPELHSARSDNVKGCYIGWVTETSFRNTTSAIFQKAQRNIISRKVIFEILAVDLVEVDDANFNG
jgi:hypothetical protein